MIISIHQPAYLPWLGYLNRIAQSDIFVFLDNVQFEKNSYTNRNKIKTANGPIWLTIPILKQGHTTKIMTEIQIDNQKNWRIKHLKAIECNYKKAKNFECNWPKLQAIYQENNASLADKCYDQLKFWMSELKITTKVVRASEINVSGAKGDLVLNICKFHRATSYLSGPLGKDYLNPEDFQAAGIDLRFQDYSHPVYHQLYGEFVPNMGVVDYWMNDGRSSNFTHQVRS